MQCPWPTSKLLLNRSQLSSIHSTSNDRLHVKPQTDPLCTDQGTLSARHGVKYALLNIPSLNDDNQGKMLQFGKVIDLGYLQSALRLSAECI